MARITSTITLRTCFPTAAHLRNGVPTPGLRAIRRTARNFREVIHHPLGGEPMRTLAAEVVFAGETRTVVNRTGLGDTGWMFEHRPEAIEEI
jgi:hypothetical protein